jgi:hypothetical protein
MPNVGTAGTYGSATTVPVITTDAQGRVTNAVNTTITFPTSVTMGGDVTGPSNACTVVKIQGEPISATAPTAGQVLGWTGTQWAPTTGGSGSISGTINYIPKFTSATAIGNSTMIETPSNMVGLNTTTPIATFDVTSTDSVQGRFYSTATAVPITWNGVVTSRWNGTVDGAIAIIGDALQTGGLGSIGVMGRGTNMGLRGVGATTATGGFAMGIRADAFSDDASTTSGDAGVVGWGQEYTTGAGTLNEAYGVYGGATDGAINNYALYGNGTPTSAGIFANNYGLFATSASSVGFGDNFGVYGEAGLGFFNNYGVYGFNPTTGTGTDFAGYFNGDAYVSNQLDCFTSTAAVKAFRIDDPRDPENKFLMHSSVESNDMMNIYNGNITTDASGVATVSLPDYFESLNKDFRYQLTVMGGTFAQAIVSKEVSGNKFEIKTSVPNTKVSWQVTGVRNDPTAQNHRLVVEVPKTGKMQGRYVDPKSYGKPASMSIGAPQKARELAKPVDKNSPLAPHQKVANRPALTAPTAAATKKN